MKVAHTAIMMILGIVLPLAVQLWDRRGQSADQRRRGWNTATWGAALYAFGPASMLGWIFVTRKQWLRVLVAPLWTVPLVLALWLADALLSLSLEHEAIETTATEILTFVVIVAVGSSAIVLVAELIAWSWRAICSVTSRSTGR